MSVMVIVIVIMICHQRFNTDREAPNSFGQIGSSYQWGGGADAIPAFCFNKTRVALELFINGMKDTHI